MSDPDTPHIFTGIALAVLATMIWSGNFIIARGVIRDIPPVTLAFFRWLSATIILLPFAWRYVLQDLPLIRSRPLYFLMAAITGVSMFNTFVYIAGHYSTAINLALLGTCTSPIFSVILAAIFLKEKITPLRITGMLVMLAGILLLLSKGSWQVLMTFSFTRGDWWVLAAAFAFAVYNMMAKQRPPGMTSSSFLLSIFLAGTLILGPFYYFEYRQEGGIQFNLSNLSVILYLGLGASVICFLLWNRSIHILGAGRTSLFGNLIPVFSSIGAVLILNEKITLFHYLSFILVVSGLVLANLKTKFKPL